MRLVGLRSWALDMYDCCYRRLQATPVVIVLPSPQSLSNRCCSMRCSPSTQSSWGYGRNTQTRLAKQQQQQQQGGGPDVYEHWLGHDDILLWLIQFSSSPDLSYTTRSRLMKHLTWMAMEECLPSASISPRPQPTRTQHLHNWIKITMMSEAINISF